MTCTAWNLSLGWVNSGGTGEKRPPPRPVGDSDIGMMYACYSLLNQAGCRLCCKEGL